MSAYRALKIALQGLPNLKRLVFSNARSGGINVNTTFMPECLEILSQYFPISEGICYKAFHSLRDPPCQGFLQVLTACHDLDRDIDKVVVQHSEGLLTAGLPMLSTAGLPEHLRALAAPAFRRIRNLSLTVSLPDREVGDKIQFADEHSFLRDALLEATQLESLDLRFESGKTELEAYTTILPMSQRLARLHTLRLENLNFDQPAVFTTFLIRRLPALRHLSLHRCEVQSTWEQVFQVLSDAHAFTLDSVDLLEPYDLVNPGDQAWPVGQPIPGVGGWNVMMPAAVPNRKLLHFINNCGTPNPFKARKWRFFDASAHQQVLESGTQVVVDDDDFDNMSEWEPSADYEKVVGFETEDPEGPEFDSEYDFDVEDDSDEEESEEDIEMIDAC